MNRSFITFALLLPCLAVNGFAQNPNPSAALDNYIQNEMQQDKLPGVSTVIVKGGEIVWIESYGKADVENNIPVTDSTAFMLASVSKLFTSTALMQLHEDGYFDLDEDINHYLPFDVDIPNFESDSITFRQLMTHTSSIEDNATAMDSYVTAGDPILQLEPCMERYFLPTGMDYSASDNFHTQAPGTFYDYSNMATALAGYLVEEISGMPFDDYCDLHLFNQICMNNTAWHLADFDTSNVARPYRFSFPDNEYQAYAHFGFADYPNGQLRSTATDLANFMIAYLQDGSLDGNELLTAASVNEMLSLQVPQLDQTQGLNWYKELLITDLSSVNVWGHNGGENGVTTDLYINRQDDIGVAVITNGEGSTIFICDELYNYALGLSPSGSGNPNCSPAAIGEYEYSISNAAAYPNPFDEQTIIALSRPLKNVQLELWDVMGRKVEASYFTKQDEVVLDGQSLNSGIYFFRVKSGETLVQAGKVIRR